ncbi:hypothetical protein J31TS4_41160 [Paenibacillus sp. J31TS4]|nr:hypothetical protein J31TS4_41160 [Paenibacillus sp. J31TS4]
MRRETEQFFDSKAKELGIRLSNVQRQAAAHTDGPLLLLASPGSGKTTTLIMRIGHLIRVKGVPPARIKAVTFSRAAASDMKERFARFFPELAPVSFSTIHSLAFEVVREDARRTGQAYRIIEGDVQPEEAGEEPEPGQLPLHKKIILRQLYQERTGERITDDQMDELTTYISYLKNKRMPESRWGEVKCGVKQAEALLRDYEAYKRTSHAERLVDFDDMLTLACEALERDGRLLRKYQQRYDYVLTDESQDTSAVQHRIVELLVQPHGNLCVVADDDQSIYSWRGAEPSYLLEFRKHYPRAEILYMEQNYRSSGISSAWPTGSSSGTGTGTAKTCLRTIRPHSRSRSNPSPIIRSRRSISSSGSASRRICGRSRSCTAITPPRSA